MNGIELAWRGFRFDRKTGTWAHETDWIGGPDADDLDPRNWTNGMPVKLAKQMTIMSCVVTDAHGRYFPLVTIRTETLADGDD